MPDGWMNWGEGRWGGMWFGPTPMAGVLFLAVAATFTLFCARSGVPIAIRNSTRTPHQILDKRFTRGEINREEFEQSRKVIEA